MTKPEGINRDALSIDGNYYLTKAFVDFLLDNGYEFRDSSFDAEWEAGERILRVKLTNKLCYLATGVEGNYVSLLNNWQEAVDHVLPKKETYQEGEWVWIFEPTPDRSCALVVYTEKDDYTYGFDHGGNWTGGFHIKIAIKEEQIKRKATKEEVENALWKEWKRRCKEAGIEDYENAKLEKHADGVSAGSLNSGIFIPKLSGSENRMWNRNGVIFDEGKWATPIKEEKQLTFGGEPVRLESESVAPVTESEIIVECQGVKGNLRQVLNILRINENLGVWFAGVRVTHIDEKEIPFKRSPLSTVTIGCLAGTFVELEEIYKEGQKLLNQ